MSTQTGSISFESTKGLHSYAKQNYATLSQIKGQFATCGTGASDTAKVATIVPADSGWTLYNGATITVKFTSKNTATAPTLNVNNTGAKPIKDFNGNDLTKAAREWPAGAAMSFTYDGTSWRLQDSDLMERVHSAETSIEQNATNIALKANSSDVYNKAGVDGLIAQEVSDRNAAIQVSAGEITQSVSSTYATKTELSDVASAGEITKSASGERYIVTEDAADLPLLTLDLIYGESVQDGTPTPDAPIYIQTVRGKNLFHFEQCITHVYNGITFTMNKDGTIRVTGTATAMADIYISNPTTNFNIITVPCGTYTFWCEGLTTGVHVITSGGSGNNGFSYFDITVGATPKTSTVIDDKKPFSYVVIRVDSGATVDTIVRPILEYGSFVHKYIPYGHLAIKSINKNVLDLPSWDILSTYPKPGSYINYPLYLEPDTTYCLNTIWTDAALAKQCGYILVATTTGNNNWKAIAHTTAGYHANATLTTDSTGILYLNVYSDQTKYESMLANAKPQLEKGSVATEYVPSVEYTTYLDLKGNELHGLDETYRDILRIDANGHAVIEKRVGKQVFDGSESWTNTNDSAAWNYLNYTPNDLLDDYKVSNAVHYSLLKSNLAYGATYTSTQSGNEGRMFLRYHQLHVVPSDTWTAVQSPTTSSTNLTSWKSVLAATPMEFYYPLDPAYWYTIDLGYVDLPQVTDNSTVYVAAEVQPVISGTWWTKAGQSVGQLAQQNKNSQGTLEAPYTELEWVESNGTQYVYLDWKPPMETWGFEADFIIYNAFNTTQGGWNPSTNKNNGGYLFGTLNSSNVNNIEVGTYSSTGYCRIGGTSGGSATNYNAKWKKDQTQQQIKLHGTTLTCADGSTVTVTRATEVANKPYANMTVFAYHNGVRKSGTGSVIWPSTSRIYSLKFFDGDELKVDLVGAKRKKDGMTGLYDKVKGHFYPAKGLLCGNEIGDLGESDTVVQTLAKQNLMAYIDNRTISRMWEVEVPTLDKLEDGQQITVVFQSNIGSSTPNQIAAAGIDDFANQWDEGVDTSYYSVYLKLILSDGSKTEWIPCYYSQGTRLTNHYGSGTPVLLTYHENMKYAETTTTVGYTVMRGWWADPNYVDGNTVYTKYSDTVIAGKNGLKRYTLCMKDDVGNWTSITTTANNYNATGKSAYTGGLQLGNILYHTTGADYAAGTNGGQLWETYGGVDLRYSVNGVTNSAATELQLRKPIYLVGTLGQDGLFYLDTTKWWTQVEPTTEDGKIYILIGTAYNSYYAIFLAANNPAYEYRNGQFMEFSYSRIKKNATDIIQTDEKIETKATATLNAAKSYADGKVSTATSELQSQITQTAGDITSTVASTYTTKTEFNNLEIGGRNLALQSKTYGSLAKTNRIIGIYGGTKVDYIDGFSAIKGTGNYQGPAIYANSLNLSVGDQITFCVNIKNDSTSQTVNFAMYAMQFDSSGTRKYNKLNIETEKGITESDAQGFNTSGILPGEERRIWAKITWTQAAQDLLDANGHLRFTWQCSASNWSNTIVYFWAPKLEKGNKATDWSPAPEDVEAYTDTQVSSAKSEIKQTTDSITSTVEKISSIKQLESSVSAGWTLVNIKSYATYDTSTTFSVTSTADAKVGDTVYIKGKDSTRNCTVYIKGLVTAVPSTTSITVKGRGYEDAVPVDSIKSTINQSADSVKIAANHVNIEGAAIFSSGRLSTTSLNNAYDAKGAANTVNNALEDYKSTTNTTLQSLQSQVDGQIEAWYMDGAPAETSYAATATPTDDAAETWTTKELKDRHLGDIYYDINTGHSWRWMEDGSNYKWQPIPDSDAAAALAAAQNAQTTANSKRRIFTTQPTVPYDKGDLWVDGTTVKYCNQTKTDTGSYAASDWILTATDDTTARTASSRSQRIYFRTNTALSNSITGPETWITKNDNGFNTTAPTTATTGWSTKPTPLAASTAADATKYLYLYTCTQTQTVAQAANSGTQCSASTVLLDDTETIIDGGKIITGSVTANALNATNINASNILTIGAFNSNTQSSILNSELASDIADAKKHTQVIISATNVDYTATGSAAAANLTARFYIDGAVQTSTNLKWQWYKDGNTQGSVQTAANGTLTVTGTMGLAHRYSCRCEF